MADGIYQATCATCGYLGNVWQSSTDDRAKMHAEAEVHNHLRDNPGHDCEVL